VCGLRNQNRERESRQDSRHPESDTRDLQPRPHTPHGHTTIELDVFDFVFEASTSDETRRVHETSDGRDERLI